MQGHSLLGGYPGNDAFPRAFHFCDFSKKIPTTVSRLIARLKGFLDGNSTLREVRAMTLWGEALLLVQSS
jgi:hypothetical protein